MLQSSMEKIASLSGLSGLSWGLIWGPYPGALFKALARGGLILALWAISRALSWALSGGLIPPYPGPCLGPYRSNLLIGNLFCTTRQANRHSSRTRLCSSTMFKFLSQGGRTNLDKAVRGQTLHTWSKLCADKPRTNLDKDVPPGFVAETLQ